MVLLLHGAYAADSLLIWGESAAVASARAKSGRRRSPATPPRSPFDAGPATLLEAAALGGLPTDAAQPRPLTLFPPSAAGRPLSSSSLIEPPSTATEPYALEPWRVAALQYPAASALALLCARQGKR